MYAVQTWNPHLVNHKEKLELVRKRTSNISEGFENLNYSERLRRLNLTWSIREDLIGIFKLQKGLEKIDWVKPPFLIKNKALGGPASRVSGNTLRLCRESFKSRQSNNFSQFVTVRHNFLLNRLLIGTTANLTDTVLNVLFSIWKPQQHC